MISAIIVDDEKHGRENLKILLNKICPDEIDVITTASSVNEAFIAINTHKPEVVFLDIDMPTGNGFTLLENADYDFQVIFVTAHDQYALKAFRFAALDYILKPINVVHLQQAIAKLKKSKNQVSDISLNAVSYFQKHNQFDRIVVTDHTGYHFIQLDNILYVEADGSYSKFHLINTERKTLTTSKPLSHFEQLLLDFGFCRVHRTHMVNLSHVTGFNTQEYMVSLTDGTQVGVSQRKKNILLSQLSGVIEGS